MTDIPQAERQEQAITALLREAPIRYFYKDEIREPTALDFLARWLTERGVRVLEQQRQAGGDEEVQPSRRKGLSDAVDLRANAPTGSPGTSDRVVGEAESTASPAAPAVDEELERLISVLTMAARRARAGTGVAQERVADAEQAIRDYVARQRQPR